MKEKQTLPKAMNKSYLTSFNKGQGNLFNEQIHLYVAYKGYINQNGTVDWIFDNDEYKLMSDMVISKSKKVKLVANKLKRQEGS